MRLIDADLLNENDGFGFFAWNTITNAPTVEAVPVVHGKWVKHGLCKRCYDYSCTNCNRFADYDSDYCPNCGAKMDEV